MIPAPETQAAATPARATANSPKRGISHSMSWANDKRELPQFIRDMIGSTPPSGSGVHGWMFNLSRQLHAHRTEQEIVDLLTAAVEGCGRFVPQREIIAAVKDSEKGAWKPNANHAASVNRPVPKWPAINTKTQAAVIQASPMSIAGLWEKSPMTCDDTEYFIDELFPGNPLLCVGESSSEFKTAPREDFRGELSRMPLIVPSPMSGLLGRKKNPEPGKNPLSAHTLDNTGPRRYLVTEFDSGTPDEQASLIWHLREFAPLIMVLWSGGKSLHAWWDCKGNDDSVTGRFMRYAVSLGADPTTWTRSQFVRIPQGWRADKQQRQEVYFFNPDAAGAENPQ